MDLPEKVKLKLKDIPDKPGCYMMRDKRGRIIYVGKAISLRKRVQSYFRDATRRSADIKTRGLVKSIYDLDYIVVRNEAEAVLTEGRLIKDFKPRYNVDFRDDKRFMVLRAGVSDPYPKFRLCRIKRDDNAVYFGPYASSSAARAALDFVERKFGIRKCQPAMPDEDTYKHCINDIIRFCAAPCVGKVSAEEYRERFDEACAFLRGERPKYLTELREKMEDASEKKRYEKAAAIRDTLFKLYDAIKQNARMISTPEMKREDAQKGVSELMDSLKLEHLPHVIEGYDISNISGTYAVASMVCAVDGVPQGNRYKRFRIKTVEGSDDPGMMAEVIKRRFSRLLSEKRPLPDLVLVDGGITQLNAAVAELEELGLNDLPVAGLAKKYEEIYLKGRSAPIRLSRDSSALKVLQRLRDEAHRFALTYHREIRRKRISESVLDDIPGIGEERKRIILKHFGSINRLKKASQEQIAEVPGIGRQMANLLYDELH